MNQEEKIEYLNSVISKDSKRFDILPNILYKYREFDDYSFDMLNNSYVFLSAAEKLDDETECNVDVSVENLIELNSSNLKRECVDQILQIIKPHTSKENYEMVRNRIYMMILPNGTLKNNYLLELNNEIKMIAPDIDSALLINAFANIPEKLDDPSIKPQIEMMISLALAAKQQIGICSFSESNNINYMWKKYADNESGYCIEYDISNYELKGDILPVIYKRKCERNTNIVVQIVGNFLGAMISSMSNGQINADISQYLSLFLTKYAKWKYQKEWRLLGNANNKVKAPKIKRIIVGKNALSINLNRIKKYCSNNNIKFEQR